jgi:hypothetical protein
MFCFYNSVLLFTFFCLDTKESNKEKIKATEKKLKFISFPYSEEAYYAGTNLFSAMTY